MGYLKIRETRAGSESIDLIEQLLKDLIGVKVFMYNLPRCSTVSVIMSGDILDRRERFLSRVEGHNACVGLEPARETCLLSDNGTATSQVIGASLTEPAAVTDDVPLLGNSELSLGLFDVSLE